MVNNSLQQHYGLVNYETKPIETDSVHNTAVSTFQKKIENGNGNGLVIPIYYKVIRQNGRTSHIGPPYTAPTRSPHGIDVTINGPNATLKLTGNVDSKDEPEDHQWSHTQRRQSNLCLHPERLTKDGLRNLVGFSPEHFWEIVHDFEEKGITKLRHLSVASQVVLNCT